MLASGDGSLPKETAPLSPVEEKQLFLQNFMAYTAYKKAIIKSGREKGMKK